MFDENMDGRHTMTPGPILLVEDDRAIREALTDGLQAEGFDVVTASNGLEALRWLRGGTARPSVVLLDIMMPVMDGYGFLAERRKDPALSSIPVAIVTAGQGVDHRQIDRDTAIIWKPIDLPHLLKTLDDLGARAAATG
jgi:CheY-like chemotaxis protein